MICFGIESTAHTFGVGIVNDKGKILANVKSMFTTKQGGIHPTHAKEYHIKHADSVINKALKEAKIKKDQIDLISFSQGPGLPPCLVVGMQKAKKLADTLKLPIIGVNHCVAHLEIGKLLTYAKDPVLLYVSGANTQIIAYEAGKYRIFGETLDNGVGNFLDAFARHIGLGFPGGPKIAKLANSGKNYIELPYVVKGMDISLGGILTNLKQKYDSGKFNVNDLAYSAQETVFAMLIEVAERAMAHLRKNELLFGGGVCCNERFGKMAKIMARERRATCFIPPKDCLVDNGAMIAWLGILNKKKSTYDYEKVDIRPRWRTDEI